VIAALDGEHVTLRVENPSPDPSAAPISDGTGTGLTNARERLALLFGDAARLDLTVGPETTVAAVSLPATTPASPDA
jgi:LytS/YehU family sensor histidine kinase